MKKIVIGIDPSLNNTGICILRNKFIKPGKHSIIRIDNTRINKKIAKWDNIWNTCRDIIKLKHKILGVYIENYSFGKTRQANLTNAGEVQGLIRFVFRNYPIYEIAPTTLKKFVLGTGRGNKNLILKEVYRKWGIDFNDDNEADAYALARMGIYKHYRSKYELLKYEEECLGKINKWN